MSIIEKAKLLRAQIEKLALDMDDTESLEYSDLFPKWSNNKHYKAGDRVRYESLLFKCLQAHTSQDDWTPDTAVSLWVRVAEPVEWPEWIQPTGGHDAYNKGDKVSHNDKHWTSDVDGNVWEPGVYGWSEEV